MRRNSYLGGGTLIKLHHGATREWRDAKRKTKAVEKEPDYIRKAAEKLRIEEKAAEAKRRAKRKEARKQTKQPAEKIFKPSTRKFRVEVLKRTSRKSK